MQLEVVPELRAIASASNVKIDSGKYLDTAIDLEYIKKCVML
ncbi:hypothetical protein [Nostoc sp. MS1]|nr:hypothetical protein [Nostoc sp. MS1]